MLHTIETRSLPAADLLPAHSFDEDAAFLDYVLDDVWDILAQGVRVSFAAAHTPTLATVRQGLPTVRTVVLRAVSRASAMVFVHADRRSGKVRELSAQPACSLHIFDTGRRVQLRIEAQASIHMDDEIADAEWQRLQAQHRAQQRRAVATAGQQHAGDLAIDDVDGLAEAGRRDDFAAIALHVTAIEWQHIGSRGHRRARFDIGETAQASWLD